MRLALSVNVHIVGCIEMSDDSSRIDLNSNAVLALLQESCVTNTD
jgi:hypothetical protein